MTTRKSYYLLIDIDAYAGNHERQLVSYAFGAIDEHCWDEESKDWKYSHNMSPTAEELEADPELTDYINLMSEAVVHHYGEYGDTCGEIEKVSDDPLVWTIVVEIGEVYWNKYITPDHIDYLFGRLNVAANHMGFHIVDCRERIITHEQVEGPLSLSRV